MALKSKLTKAEFDALPEALKEFYKKADGKEEYLLDSEDAAELRRAKDREAQARQEAEELAAKEKKRADDAEAKLNEEIDGGARKRKDIDALEKSWQGKLDKEKADAQKKIDARDAIIRRELGDNVALGLATKISTKPNLILPHIKSRITVDFDGDEPKTRILDKDGKPSALTVEDLQKEFVANADFADIIIASQASGSGASGGSGGGGASKKLSEMGDAERREWHQRDPGGFAKAVEADKTSAKDA